MYDVGRNFRQCPLQIAAREQARRKFEYLDPRVHVIDDTLSVFAVIPAQQKRNPVLRALLVTGFGGRALGTGKSAGQKDVRNTQ